MRGQKSFITSQILSAHKLHQFDRVVLINHSDCGAYKLSGKSFEKMSDEDDFHSDELKGAKEYLGKALPEVMVEVRFFNKKEGRFEW